MNTVGFINQLVFDNRLYQELFMFNFSSSIKAFVYYHEKREVDSNHALHLLLSNHDQIGKKATVSVESEC